MRALAVAGVPGWIVFVGVSSARADEPPARPTPPTAAFELLPADQEPDPSVAEDAPLEPPAVPKESPWVPISNATDYQHGFDRPWHAPPPVERRWYGWQTLLSDAASIGLFVSGINDEHGSDARPTIGLFGYVLGGPIIHGAHGHALKSFASLGLRLSAPVVGALVGYGMAGCERSHDDHGEDWCGAGGAIVGAMIGTLGAMSFDALVIANEDVEPERARERVQVRPDVSIAPGRAEVSLSGVF